MVTPQLLTPPYSIALPLVFLPPATPIPIYYEFPTMPLPVSQYCLTPFVLPPPTPLCLFAAGTLRRGRVLFVVTLLIDVGVVIRWVIRFVVSPTLFPIVFWPALFMTC